MDNNDQQISRDTTTAPAWMPGTLVGKPGAEDSQGENPQWYRDAVIYQTHIKAFFDNSNDGIGDVNGLIEKLDYIRDLGATAIWLLPFYPSPLRDDGYDIQDYRAINSSYGSMSDIRRLIRAAHKRGLRLITELVVNHTSDQHPWFQRARAAKPGSAHRNYYVWSDTDQLYRDTRIIFLDTETSNWTWDPVAKAYFWHRFYSHQPDLNFDNPKVVEEIIAVLHYWLKLGVDGFRLDAVPYLIEREGTNCENLPETHDILRRIRAEVDAHYPGRMLLAEANQWPEDTRPYFGSGDQCHMAFHFPLMPRMYLSIAREDRHPITDIMAQTPDIPDGCQWAIFLRNHDELTLEMVTDKERDYLWDTYAADNRMRINMGIRRRLAPLMGNDRRKIELMNSLLMSMPGTPVLYYGDEIGMGDNVYLGDRDGVRTPMQWAPDRNGGFSRADPQRLYLPPIQDAVYGYQAVNVESQRSNPSSLLHWTQRLIAVRQSYRAFARGKLRFLFPGNRKILAYLRQLDEQTILCVVNLSRHAQPVELNLQEFEGDVPIELLGQNPFPPIGKLPYLLTLPAHGFYWFLLEPEAAAPDWHHSLPEALPDLTTLVSRSGWKGLLEAENKKTLEKQVLPRFIQGQRWYGHKDCTITGSKLVSADSTKMGKQEYLLCRLALNFDDDQTALYSVPLALNWDEEALLPGNALQPFVLARIRSGPRLGSLIDATTDPGFAFALIKQMNDGDVETDDEPDSGLRFIGSTDLADLAIGPQDEVHRLKVEQSNTSLMIGDKVMVKLYRRLSIGDHPEVELGRFLSGQKEFTNTPQLLGSVETAGEEKTLLATAYQYVRNQGDAWQYILTALEGDISHYALSQTLEAIQAHIAENAAGAESESLLFSSHISLLGVLGERTGQMHHALASDTDSAAFAPEPINKTKLASWRKSSLARFKSAIAHVKRVRTELGEEWRPIAERMLADRGKIESTLREVGQHRFESTCTRIHGDFHLGQVLIAKEDCFILDFEGEPARPLAQRREKGSPLQDVAGMLRSLDYMRQTVAQRLASENAATSPQIHALLDYWYALATSAFIKGYRSGVGKSSSVPASAREASTLLRHFLLDKAFYEISYEAANRPRWIGIPMMGAAKLLAEPGWTKHLWESGDD